MSSAAWLRWPAQQGAHHPLLHADGVGQRHHHDLPPDAPGGVVRPQQPDQVLRHQHPRHLVRMERRLHVNLGPGAGLAEPVDLQRLHGPRRGAAQRHALDGHTAARKSKVRGCSGDTLAGGSGIGPGVWPMASNRARRRASASLALTGKVS